MGTIAGITAIASLAGTAISAVGTIAAGQAAKRQAEWEAQQHEIKGKEEFASAQRDAQQLARQKRLALSRHQAVSAASGAIGGEEIAAEIAGYGKEQELSALAAGEMRRRDRTYAAAGARASGRSAQTGSYFTAAGTILGGIADAGSFHMKYGNGGYGSRSSPTRWFG